MMALELGNRTYGWRCFSVSIDDRFINDYFPVDIEYDKFLAWFLLEIARRFEYTEIHR